ncbi:hypothetical protein ACVMB2_003928 [Sinorhizobium meliloti]
MHPKGRNRVKDRASGCVGEGLWSCCGCLVGCGCNFASWAGCSRPRREKSDRAVKVISSSSGNLSGRSARIGDDNPLTGYKAGKAIVVAENRSCDLLARAGGSNMVLQRLFADLSRGSNGLPAGRVHRVLYHMLHRRTGRVVRGLDRRLDHARLGDYGKIDLTAVMAAQLGNKRFLGTSVSLPKRVHIVQL